MSSNKDLWELRRTCCKTNIAVWPLQESFHAYLAKGAGPKGAEAGAGAGAKSGEGAGGGAEAGAEEGAGTGVGAEAGI